MDMIDRLISREGGARITRDPVDPGGVTKFGISQRSYPQLDIANLTYDQAKDIYIRDYYVGHNVHLLPSDLQEPVLDYAVHSGQQTAIRALQRLAGVKDDGIIGVKTLDAIKTHGADVIKSALQRERALFLIRQVKKTPAKIKYLEGWISRVLSF
jgi:lysozyme family protein